MDSGYLGNSNLKKVGVDISFTEEQAQEFIKCAHDPVYFIKTYVKIVNVDLGLIPFNMWDFQEEIQRTGVNKMAKSAKKRLAPSKPKSKKTQKTNQLRIKIISNKLEKL